MKKFIIPFFVIFGFITVYFYMNNQGAYEPVGSNKLIISRSQSTNLNKTNEELTAEEKSEEASKRPMVLSVAENENFTEKSIGLSEQELDSLEEYFDKIETEWEEEIKNLFVAELNLDANLVKEYFSMREDLEVEKDKAFQHFHEQMRKKHGENYAYSPTADQESYEDKILEGYYTVLKEKMGEEKYIEYIKVKERFNDRLRSEQNPTTGVLFIEF